MSFELTAKLIDALEAIIKADNYRMAVIASPDCSSQKYEFANEKFWAAIDGGREAMEEAKKRIGK